MSFQFFDREDFACKCGCGLNEIRDDFIRFLDKARERAGIPFVVNSGYRCPENDEKVGGKGNHTTGTAADIRVRNSHERFLVVNALLNLGAKRVGPAKTFVHVDVNPEKPGQRLWLYS